MNDVQQALKTIWVVSDVSESPFQIELQEGEELPNGLHPIVDIKDLPGLGLNPYTPDRSELFQGVRVLGKEAVRI